MKPLVFSKNSWHFKLAKIGGIDLWHEPDFCEYVRKVILGFVLFTAVCIMGLAVIFSVGQMLAWFAAMVYSWQYIVPEPPAIIAATALGLAAMVFVAIQLVRLYEWLQERRYINKMIRTESKDYKPPEPGFVSRAYQTFKEKTCFRVEFK